MSPRLTVAIPFYRGLDYLAEAVSSVRAQHCPDWELLISDDGGGEAAALLLPLAAADPRIRYRRNERNLGMVGNWNLCIDSAGTELVCLLHGDDRLLPSYVGSMLEVAEREPGAVAFFCDAEIIDAHGRRRFSFADAMKRPFVPRHGRDVRLEGEDALRILMAGNFIMCPTLCLRRSLLGERRFEEGWKQAQDLEFSSRLLMQDELLVGVRETAYAYRRHDEGATALQSESLLRFEEEFLLFARVAEAAAVRGWPGAARTARRAAIVKLHLAYRILSDLVRLRLPAAARKARFLARHLRMSRSPSPPSPPSSG